MLDLLGAGVANFDASNRLTAAIQPSRPLFKLAPRTRQDPPVFERLLDAARDAGRVPEVRDFPAWRREKAAWFASGDAQEEPWSLADGTHLRIVAQPVPDGGLLMIVEARTEQLGRAACRERVCQYG